MKYFVCKCNRLVPENLQKCNCGVQTLALVTGAGVGLVRMMSFKDEAALDRWLKLSTQMGMRFRKQELQKK